MEILLRTQLLAWLRADPAISTNINLVAEEAPLQASLPWLAISASASADWSVKGATGREVRIALELHYRGDSTDAMASLVGALEDRIAAMPSGQPGFSIVTTQFLRARAEQRPGNTRAMLLEYRFRLLAA